MLADRGYIYMRTTSKWRGIFARTFAIMSILSLLTIIIFCVFEIPRNRTLILNGLDSQAKSLSASIAEVSGNAFVTGDYSFIIDHNMQVIKGSPDILYIIVVKEGGQTTIHTLENWVQTDTPDPSWRLSQKDIPEGRILPKHGDKNRCIPLRIPS